MGQRDTRRSHSWLSAPDPCYRATGKVLRWYLGWQYRGMHRRFKHSSKPGRVTVSGKPSDNLAPGTLNSILKQAGLKKFGAAAPHGLGIMGRKGLLIFLAP